MRPLCGAAHQGDGAAADAQKRILAEQGHDAAPQEILHGDHGYGHQQTEDHRLAALQKGGDADGEAHSGEEHDHKDALKGVVKGNGGSSRGIEDAVHDGEAQAAHQGRGNTVAVQEADLAGDHASQPEQECAQRNSVVHIQTDLKHSCTVLSLCYFALQSFSGHRPPTQSNGFCKSKNTAF